MAMASTSGLGSELSTDSFMKLFVTQLQYQNPLQPQDSSAFLSQLAQFSTLEQQQQQTKYLSNMGSINAAALQVDQLSMASTFIGKTIKYLPEGEDGSSNNTLTGVVSGVKLEKDGSVSFVVDGKSVPLANFVEMTAQ
ncbi:MAG: flagellar hook assembly protein FlgD [Planctomycetes bacterium]|nr:flagellar hook assembly protein FlgD [Planctomycetota bacterium]